MLKMFGKPRSVCLLKAPDFYRGFLVLVGRRMCSFARFRVAM
jgi:hypothetical protein